jgi:LuxR family maltose regulon positive regulatory protein
MARTIEEREQAGPVRTRPWLISMLLDLIATSQVWLWLMQGNLEAARDVALERQWDLDADITLFQDRGPGLLARVRVLIAQAHYARALGVLERLLAAANASGRAGWVIEILALQALVLQAQKDESAAVGALESALKLAEPEGYVRTFVDEGQSMAALLRKAHSRGIARDYTEDLLAAFGTPDTQRRDQPTLTATQEPITARELQVLRLLADGASNAELARALIVEQSTVKTHLLHLYGKLDVHNRTQAVARARALLLLD